MFKCLSARHLSPNSPFIDNCFCIDFVDDGYMCLLAASLDNGDGNGSPLTVTLVNLIMTMKSIDDDSVANSDFDDSVSFLSTIALHTSFLTFSYFHQPTFSRVILISVLLGENDGPIQGAQTLHDTTFTRRIQRVLCA